MSCAGWRPGRRSWCGSAVIRRVRSPCASDPGSRASLLRRRPRAERRVVIGLLIALIIVAAIVAMAIRARRLRSARARGAESANPVVVIGSVFVMCAVIVGVALLVHR